MTTHYILEIKGNVAVIAYGNIVPISLSFSGLDKTKLDNCIITLIGAWLIMKANAEDSTRDLNGDRISTSMYDRKNPS